MIKVSDLFKLKYGVNLEYYTMTPDKNGLPFITRSERNNGMKGRVLPIERVEPNPAHTISVACSGSDYGKFFTGRALLQRMACPLPDTQN